MQLYSIQQSHHAACLFLFFSDLPRPQASSKQEIEDALATLRANAEKWSSMPIEQKGKLFKQCVATTLGAADLLEEVEVQAKGLYDMAPNELS